MRHLSQGATILIFLLVFYYFSNGNSYILNRDVPAIGLIQERSWCSRIKDEKQFLQIDLGRTRTITGIASRKDDTMNEFKMSYKKNNDGSWYFYEEEGSVKIFRVNEKSEGRISRHWLLHKIMTRYLKFHVTKWQHPACLHVEIYGWENAEMRTDVLRGNTGRSPPIFQELSMDREERNDDEKLEKEEPTNQPDKPTPRTQDKESHMSLTITMCFLATGIIAILALIIVCKWERHERKIRPDYLRASLGNRLKSNLGRRK